MGVDEKLIILFGAGQSGVDALHRLGKERVAYFCDNKHAGEDRNGIKILSFDEMAEIHSDYRIVVSVDFYPMIVELSNQLNRTGIPHEYFLVMKNCLHVYRDNGGDIQFERESKALEPWAENRFTNGTIQMIRDSFDKFPDEVNKTFSAWIYGGDWTYEADICRELIGVDHIFSYSTSYALSDRVIPIPDYKFYHSGYAVDDRTLEGDELLEELWKKEEQPWKDERAFWVGNISNSEARYRLKVMSERYPEKICVKSFYVQGTNQSGLENYVEMKDFSDYKYLIDVRGYGWTDRVKLLLAMGRPLLLVDRPFVEYYYSLLEPMKNYVPIREDLSDLIEKIDYLDGHSDIYNSIVKNARMFTEEYFKRDEVLKTMANVIKRSR